MSYATSTPTCSDPECDEPVALDFSDYLDMREDGLWQPLCDDCRAGSCIECGALPSEECDCHLRAADIVHPPQGWRNA